MRVHPVSIAGRWLALAFLFYLAIPFAHAQGSPSFASDHSRPVKERPLPGGFPLKPSLPPTFTIPVEPLGFSPPGPLYLGERNNLVSLDFIDENRLLFTFRVPGLIHRELKAGDAGDSEERQIRAVVITLSTGAVEAEALFTVHDRSRYLWMLKDGHFLVKDKENLQQGDAHLDLKPLLRFPGALTWLEIDPTGQYLVTNSHEPADTPAKSGEVDSPATASATVTQDNESSSNSPTGNPDADANPDASPQPPDAQPLNMVVRILRRDSGKVMLVSRVRTTVHLPINAEGYLESLRGRAGQWVLDLNLFTGGSRVLGNVDSVCVPTPNFLSEQSGRPMRESNRRIHESVRRHVQVASGWPCRDRLRALPRFRACPHLRNGTLTGYTCNQWTATSRQS